MRAAQLLAVGMICLPVLACLGSACGRVTSKVGEYANQSNLGLAGRGGGSAGTAGPTGNAGTIGSGTAGDGMQADADSGMPVTPVVSSGDGKCEFEPLADSSRHPLDVYVMMDSNLTLALGLWELSVIGLRNFANDPKSAGMGLGVRYYGSECDRTAYAQPAVEIAPLPSNAAEIVRSTMQSPFKSSQMLPALRGAIDHQKTRAAANASAKQVVALITDGYTQDFNIVCPLYQTSDVVAAAQAGMNGTTPIETYVLKLTSSLPGADFAERFGQLDNVAAAGGTGAGIEIQTSDATGGTHAALSEVRRRAQPCEYTLPAHADPTRVSLALVDAGGANPSELARVTASDACGSEDGWHFDDSASPKYLRLCEKTCATLRANDAHVVVPLSGCLPKTR
jgi:hypothetical protein